MVNTLPHRALPFLAAIVIFSSLASRQGLPRHLLHRELRNLVRPPDAGLGRTLCFHELYYLGLIWGPRNFRLEWFC